MSGGACSTSAVTIANTSVQQNVIQPTNNATFSFPLTLNQASYGGSGQCTFNMTVNFAVSVPSSQPRLHCSPNSFLVMHSCLM